MNTGTPDKPIYDVEGEIGTGCDDGKSCIVERSEQSPPVYHTSSGGLDQSTAAEGFQLEAAHCTTVEFPD